MVFITQEQIEILRPYVNNLDELIQQEDDVLLLEAINDLIIQNILDNDDEPNEEGIMLQRIWDAIFFKMNKIIIWNRKTKHQCCDNHLLPIK